MTFHTISHSRFFRAVATKGEVIGNMVLVAVTGLHEGATAVGFACGPLFVVLVVHLVVELTEDHS